jgi:hypothetical protein
MSFKLNNSQKSLKRRFLLILGAITFICVFGLGVMILFWDKILPQLDGYYRTAFGVMVIAYSILRFSRLLKKEDDEA